MAKLDLWSCDNCGKHFRCGEGEVLTLVTEDSATSKWTESADLCSSCLGALVMAMAACIHPNQRAAVMGQFTSKKGQ
jgi:hypothetical protein